MKTDQSTNATPEAVCSTAMLGPMVERIGSPPDTHCWDDDSAADCWSYSPQMVAELLDAAVAAERERCAKLCEERAAPDLAGELRNMVEMFAGTDESPGQHEAVASARRLLAALALDA